MPIFTLEQFEVHSIYHLLIVYVFSIKFLASLLFISSFLDCSLNFFYPRTSTALPYLENNSPKVLLY